MEALLLLLYYVSIILYIIIIWNPITVEIIIIIPYLCIARMRNGSWNAEAHVSSNV